MLSEVSCLVGFINEGGVDGWVCYLYNVMGLWLLSECVCDWECSGEIVVLLELFV